MISTPITSLLANIILTGDNYQKWKSNINIVLVSENIRYILTEICPPPSIANAPRATRDAYDNWRSTNNKAKGCTLCLNPFALNWKRRKLQLK